MQVSVGPGGRGLGGHGFLHKYQFAAGAKQASCHWHFLKEDFRGSAALQRQRCCTCAGMHAGDLFYYFLQMVWAVYRQLAAMKVLPQITAGGWKGAEALRGCRLCKGAVVGGCQCLASKQWGLKVRQAA